MTISSAPQSIHHINLLVRSLDTNVKLFEKVLSQTASRQRLSDRGVDTASFSLGGSYLVLVSPFDDTSLVQQILNEKGQGLFLLSLGVNDLDKALEYLQSQSLVGAAKSRRTGLDGWTVEDIAIPEELGFVLQFCQNSG